MGNFTPCIDAVKQAVVELDRVIDAQFQAQQQLRAVEDRDAYKAANQRLRRLYGLRNKTLALIDAFEFEQRRSLSDI